MVVAPRWHSATAALGEVEMMMKRLCAFVIGLAMLLAIPGLVTATAAAAPVSRDQYVQIVIDRGLAQRGVPYSWAGGDITGPTLGKGPGATTVGFDSSGLIQYVYAGVGAKLPRSSGDMYKVGQHVTADQALPGDLLFYGPDGTQSVAMFLGNGQMLEVTDTVVAVSPVRTTDLAPYLVRVIA
ncbi:hydrolase [Mycolicibacterium litorale]|nr:hydrolase [Mycolicibacterium litorale]